MRPYAIDRGQHLTLLKGHGEFSVPHGPLDLEVNQTIEGNEGWNLALDEGIDFTDVPHHHRHEPESASGIAPREPCRNADLLAIANSWLSNFWNLSRIDSLNHEGPLEVRLTNYYQCAGPRKIETVRYRPNSVKLLI